MLIFAAFLLILYLVIGVASLGSRDRTQHDFEDYHHDPYYYYPRNQPPPYFSGYQPYPVQPHYLPPPPPPVRYATMRPQPGGGSFFSRLIMFMVLAALLFGLAIKMDLIGLNIHLTFGNQVPENYFERQQGPIPPMYGPGEGYNPLVSAKKVK